MKLAQSLDLFRLRHANSRTLVPDLTFPSKELAKQARNELALRGYPTAVTYGPDHRHYGNAQRQH